MKTHDAYGWARRFLLLFAIAAISGAGLFFAGWNIQWVDTALLIALCIALAGGVICITILYLALGVDERFDKMEVREMRRKLLLFGPLGALEILMSRPGRRRSERHR